jgi:catechol 2,3-dioxygenase-like lactoylglutathione lyase family enzyme
MLVADMERSIRFYVGALGGTVIEDAVVQIPSLAILSRGGSDRVRIVLVQLPGAAEGESTIELMELQPGAKPVEIHFGSKEATLPSLWSFSLLVYDLEEVIAELAAVGVAPTTPIDVVQLPRIGTCRIAFVRDPDGNLIELIDVPSSSSGDDARR